MSLSLADIDAQTAGQSARSSPGRVRQHCRVETGDMIGDYSIESRLGSGKYATVWKAANAAGELRAIKIYHHCEGYLEEYAAEVDMMHAIRLAGATPHVVAYYGTFIHMFVNDSARLCIHPCVVMGAASASARCIVDESEDGVPQSVVKMIMRGVFNALAYLHAHGFIHMDVKPENILVDYDGGEYCAYLGDIGSCVFSAAPPEYPVVTTGYEAPELVVGAEYGPAVDVWAAMVSCYELLTSGYLYDINAEYGTPYNYLLSPMDRAWDGSDEASSDGSSDVSSTGSESSSEWGDYDSSVMNYRLLLLTALIIGPAPPDFVVGASDYYNNRGKLRDDPGANGCLADLLCAHIEIAPSDCAAACEFMMKGLQYCARDRVSAASAATDEWLA